MQYVTFLRAINVGRHNRIRMVDLRERCAALGLADVQTYLQTGNVVFQSTDSANEVAALLEEALVTMGCRNADAIVFGRDEFLDLLKLRPFDEHDPERFRRMVTLAREPLPENARQTLSTRGISVLASHRRAIFTLVAIGQADPPDLNGLLEKTFKIPTTTRYWQVLEALSAMGAHATRSNVDAPATTPARRPDAQPRTG